MKRIGRCSSDSICPYLWEHVQILTASVQANPDLHQRVPYREMTVSCSPSAVRFLLTIRDNEPCFGYYKGSMSKRAQGMSCNLAVQFSKPELPSGPMVVGFNSVACSDPRGRDQPPPGCFKSPSQTGVCAHILLRARRALVSKLEPLIMNEPLIFL